MGPYESTVLITGGTTGIGLECAKEIAKQKPNSLVLICSRNLVKEAAAVVDQQTGSKNIQYLRLDLSDLGEVRKFVSTFADSAYPPISALLLNAGLQVVSGISYTANDIETTFGVNHVGHALLFYLLMPHLANKARIVLTASGVHDPLQKTGMPEPKYPTAELLAHPDESMKKDDGRLRYTTSKLCNVLWAYALEHHRSDKGFDWTVNSFDPGLMPGTGLAREYPAPLRFLWHQVLPRVIPLLRSLMFSNIHSPAESGHALTRLAISEDVAGVTGKYYEGLKPIDSSQLSYDKPTQVDLWDWTAQYLGRNPEEINAYKNLDLTRKA